MMALIAFLALQTEDPAGTMARERKKAVALEKILEKTPDDPDANGQLGRFLCFFSEDWSRGIPMLAKGRDEGLKSAAGKELAGEAAGLVAEAWWSLASKHKGFESRIRAHAAEWYRKAYLKTEDRVEKMKLSGRLAEFYKAQGPIQVKVVAGEAWVDTKIDLIPGMTVQVRTTGSWCLDGNPDKTKWCEWKGYPKWFVKDAPVPTAQSMCLVAKTSEGGKPVAVYKDFPFAVAGVGRLFLGPNDGSPQDNQGELSVLVEISI